MLDPVLTTMPSPRPRRRGAVLEPAAVERIYSWMRQHPDVRGVSALAAASGLSASMISRVLAGKRTAVPETLDAIAAALGHTRRELLAPAPGPERLGQGEVGGRDAVVYKIDRRDPLDAARRILEAEGYAGLVVIPVETADLMDRHPPITPGMHVWIDAMIPPSGGRVVCVEVAGQRLLRSLAPNGRTLTSAVPGTPPLELGEVDRVVGVGRLAQIAL